MSSVAVSVAGLGVDFARRRDFILGWPGDEEWVEVMWDGRITWIPGRGTVANRKENTRFRWDPAKTEAGEPIPGTVVIFDEFNVNESGNRVMMFNALEYCRGLASNALLMTRGLIILDDVKKLPDVWDKARDLWEASQDQHSEQVLRLELERIARWESKGQPAPPPPNTEEISRAKEHIERRKRHGKLRAFTKADLLKALDVTAPPPDVDGVPPAPAVPQPVAELSPAMDLSRFPAAKPDLAQTEGEYLPDDPEERKKAVVEAVARRAARRR